MLPASDEEAQLLQQRVLLESRIQLLQAAAQLRAERERNERIQASEADKLEKRLQMQLQIERVRSELKEQRSEMKEQALRAEMKEQALRAEMKEQRMEMKELALRTEMKEQALRTRMDQKLLEQSLQKAQRESEKKVGTRVARIH